MADAARTPDPGYAPDRVSIAGIVLGALSVVGAVGLALLAALIVLHVGSGSTARPAAPRGTAVSIAGPVRLEPDPAQDIARFRAEKARQIDSYEWLDREHNFARIPIERAMTLLTRSESTRRLP